MSTSQQREKWLGVEGALADGAVEPLLERLGTELEAASLESADRSPSLQQAADLAGLRRFLAGYESRVLLPLEWPAILEAHRHTAHNELREMLELDARLAREAALTEFAAASCRVGQRQLSKLRPLRDQKIVQRYLRALEEGRARGWHTIAYGISLQVFAIPLRQGLAHYAQQTFHGYAMAMRRALQLNHQTIDELVQERSAHWPGAINELLDQRRLGDLRIS